MMSDTKNSIQSAASPLRLFCWLLAVMFIGELLVMFLLPILLPGAERIVENFADSALLTIMTAPLLWVLIVEPLRNAAMGEEMRARAILENVVDGVAILDEGGVIESFNEAAGKIFGYSPQEAEGMAMKVLLPELDISSGNAGKWSNSSHETVGTRKDGLSCPLDFSVSRVRIGARFLQVCIMHDISERKEAEERIRNLNTELVLNIYKLKKAQEELVRRERLATIGQVADNMGRELRDTLGGVSNAVYFLKNQMPDSGPVVKEYLEIINHEVDNSVRLIASLFDFAWPREPVRSPVMVDELVGESLGKCRIPENIAVSVDISGVLPQIGVDRTQVGQVLQNLVANAVQAMPNGGTLRIGARRRVQGSTFKVQGSETNIEHGTLNIEPDADFIEISIEDTGEGVSPENMKKLFQPLFTTKARGIGLGLAVARSLAELNGGRTEAESEVGKGTTFKVILPVEVRGRSENPKGGLG